MTIIYSAGHIFLFRTENGSTLSHPKCGVRPTTQSRPSCCTYQNLTKFCCFWKTNSLTKYGQFSTTPETICQVSYTSLFLLVSSASVVSITLFSRGCLSTMYSFFCSPVVLTIVFMETTLSQYTSQGVITFWSKISPVFEVRTPTVLTVVMVKVSATFSTFDLFFCTA